MPKSIKPSATTDRVPSRMRLAGGAISVGGSGSATIQRNGVGAQTVTAHLNWLDGNQPVAANTELLIQFFRDENKWVIVGAECGA